MVDKAIEEIYFFVPLPELIQTIPASVEEYWSWIGRYFESPSAKHKYDGPFSWVLLTYLYLRDSGFPCNLVSSLPEEGIVVLHADFLSPAVNPSRKRTIVLIKADREIDKKALLSSANFVIVQNHSDPVKKGWQRFFIKGLFVTHWPQPCLIARDAKRGDRFENICYVGNTENMHPRLGEFDQELKSMNLSWKTIRRNNWNDYSEIDAVVGLRPDFNCGYADKPATKLYNAWLAGVPAILGPETSYKNLRKSKYDYLEAKNIPEVIENLKLLKLDVDLRRKMVENGKKRAQEFTPQEIIKEWKLILKQKIVPYHKKWRASFIRRGCFYILRVFLGYLIRAARLLHKRIYQRLLGLLRRLISPKNIEGFGTIYSSYFACSADDNIRWGASSGGFCKSFLVFLIEKKITDAAIVTRTGPPQAPLQPETIVTSCAEDIVSTRTNSVYASTNPLAALKDIEDTKSYAFIGLSCHCKKLRELQLKGIARNCKVIIALLCNYAPNLEFTRDILKKISVAEQDIKQIEYRGHGWPGEFTAYLKDGSQRRIKLTGCFSREQRYIPRQCDICREFPIESDIVACDPWNLGLEKQDTKGTTMVICKNRNADMLVRAAKKSGYITLRRCTVSQIIRSQMHIISRKCMAK